MGARCEHGSRSGTGPESSPTTHAQANMRACGALAPARPAKVTSLHRDGTWSRGIATMWDHYRTMKRQIGVHTRSIWRAWKHMAKFCRASRAFRKEAKHRKKQLVDGFLSEAHQCALQGDVSQWYKRVRYICPKTKLDSIHLRADDGTLLSPEKSIQALHAHYYQLFHDPSHRPCTIPPLFWAPFTIPEIEHALGKLPLRKATLPSKPPAVAWRAAAGSLATHIHATLEQFWCGESFTLPAESTGTFLCCASFQSLGKLPTALRP